MVQDGDDLKIVEENLVLSTYPHARVDCPVDPIVDATTASIGCELCYCYVCDVQSSLCSGWAYHHNSSGAKAVWRAVKSTRRFSHSAVAIARNESVQSLVENFVEVVVHSSMLLPGTPAFRSIISVDDHMPSPTDEPLDNSNPSPAAAGGGDEGAIGEQVDLELLVGDFDSKLHFVKETKLGNEEETVLEGETGVVDDVSSIPAKQEEITVCEAGKDEPVICALVLEAKYST
uniref:Uncharacterized protein n=1 Tax=Rhodosorus marinus TaxID=101924 RepID=A0A7S3E7Q4_9RHOD|mmetsp:Transcript_12818/g.51369  ORF Transcript_12818/g.51369 Transcript_12818/m.51369 type:complete len:232 (+) Transcript_12818:173-868(+)